jgi:hypothetical protein
LCEKYYLRVINAVKEKGCLAAEEEFHHFHDQTSNLLLGKPTK